MASSPPSMAGSAFPPLSAPVSSALLNVSVPPPKQPAGLWSSLLAKQSEASSFAVSYVKPPESGPITFSADEVQAGAQYWDLSLVGYAAGRRPSYLTLLAAIKRIWKPKGALDLLTLDDGFFLFKFSCHEDYDYAWSNGPWYFLSRPFILKKWKPGLTLSKEDMSSIPIWCNLSKIPLECWNESGISKIASKIGKPLVVDKLTASKSRINFARVCVEVTADDILHESIDLLVNDNPVTILVKYDWKPAACSHCKTFDHAGNACSVFREENPIVNQSTNTSPNRGRSRSRRRTKAPIQVAVIPSPPPQSHLTLHTEQVIPSSQQGKVINLNTSPTTSTSNVTPASSLLPLHFGSHSPIRHVDDQGTWTTKGSGNPAGKGRAKQVKEMPPPRHLRSNANANAFKALDNDALLSDGNPNPT